MEALRSFRTVVEPVLGTRLTLRIDAIDASAAHLAGERVVDEADRLEGLLSAYRSGSEFARWRRGELDAPGAEVGEVLAVARSWHERTGGAFHAATAGLTARWQDAANAQRLPGASELADLAAACARLPYEVVDGCVRRTGDCRLVDVHGVAKGWVVDRLSEVALRVTGVGAVLVDLGGDLRHAGPEARGPVRIAIEDPWRVADNATPLITVSISGQAVATSAGGRRGWTIDGRWFGHLLDPRTGWPLAEGRSATVVAATAADADAWASAFTVLDAEPAAALAGSEGVAVLVVAESGEVWRSPAWRSSVEEAGISGSPRTSAPA